MPAFLFHLAAVLLSVAPAVATPPARLPSPAPATLTVGGGLSREEIQIEVLHRTPDIKHCYEARLRSRPDLAGRLVLEWSINAKGEVEDARISEDTIDDAAMNPCILAIVRGMRFPSPKGGGKVNVTYPFVFATDAADLEPSPRHGVSVAGPLGKSVVTEVVGEVSASFTDCAGVSEGIGQVRLRFTIDAGGTVSAVATEASSLQKADADTCIKKVASGLVFPTSTAETRVVYPLLFLPPEPPDEPVVPKKAPPAKASGCAWPW